MKLSRAKIARLLKTGNQSRKNKKNRERRSKSLHTQSNNSIFKDDDLIMMPTQSIMTANLSKANVKHRRARSANNKRKTLNLRFKTMKHRKQRGMKGGMEMEGGTKESENLVSALNELNQAVALIPKSAETEIVNVAAKIVNAIKLAQALDAQMKGYIAGDVTAVAAVNEATEAASAVAEEAKKLPGATDTAAVTDAASKVTSAAEAVTAIKTKTSSAESGSGAESSDAPPEGTGGEISKITKTPLEINTNDDKIKTKLNELIDMLNGMEPKLNADKISDFNNIVEKINIVTENATETVKSLCKLVTDDDTSSVDEKGKVEEILQLLEGAGDLPPAEETAETTKKKEATAAATQ